MTRVGHGPNARPGGRSAVVRRKVLTAALHVLELRGWTGVGVDEVAGLAGVHKTTIYRRWATVGELLREAVLTFCEDTVQVPDTGAVRRDLIMLLEAVAANITTGTGRALLAATSHAEAREDIDALHQQIWRQRLDGAAEILRRAAARGEIPEPEHPDFLIEMLIAPLFFRAVVAKRQLRKPERERIVDSVLQACRGSGVIEEHAEQRV